MHSSQNIDHNIKAQAGRIAKLIARAGVCSRREAERLIAQKRVTLNGTTVDSPAVNVTARDVICVDGRPIEAAEKVRLWRYHKQKGQVTTRHDPQGRQTVFDALPDGMPRVISIGRLDYNTEGLLLFTNDGALSRHLELPATGWLRRYRVRVNGRPKQPALDALAKGVDIDGVHYGPIEARLDGREQAGANAWLTIGLREGKNREVRKIMEHLGLQVTRLIRVSFGPFMLGDLEPGAVEEIKSRALSEQLGATIAAEFGLKAPEEGALRARPAPKKLPPVRGGAGMRNARPTAAGAARPERSGNFTRRDASSSRAWRTKPAGGGEAAAENQPRIQRRDGDAGRRDAAPQPQGAGRTNLERRTSPAKPRTARSTGAAQADARPAFRRKPDDARDESARSFPRPARRDSANAKGGAPASRLAETPPENAGRDDPATAKPWRARPWSANAPQEKAPFRNKLERGAAPSSKPEGLQRRDKPSGDFHPRPAHFGAEGSRRPREDRPASSPALSRRPSPEGRRDEATRKPDAKNFATSKATPQGRFGDSAKPSRRPFKGTADRAGGAPRGGGGKPGGGPRGRKP